MRLFLDANILFSASWKDDSPAALLFQLAAAGFCRLSTSRLALEEARRNINHKRPERLAELEALMRQVIVDREPAVEHLAAAAGYGLPDKDLPILAAALAQSADLLVTGDRRDFGHLYGRRIGNLEIIGLADAVERVLESARLESDPD